MGLVDKYRWGNVSNIPASSIDIDSLATLESIKRRQGWMIAAQVATVAAIAHQTQKTTDALRLVNDTLISIESTIQDGFDSLESSIERLEANLIENLNEIKWYLFNVDQKLDQLINLVKFSGATKSAEFNKQGFILYKIGSYDDAINQLNKSLQENPLNIEAYINLGFVFLRQEKLDESIRNFEKAAKLVKEDFSYFEEVSKERLDSTENFILDNLSTLYSLQNKYELSIDAIGKVLSKNIDKKTEVVSKFKLSKYLCLSGEHNDALNIIRELIDGQYFEPVSLAVAGVEFSPISSSILSLLQDKLQNVKQSYDSSMRVESEKLDSIDLESGTKLALFQLLEKAKSAINESSNYSILLTSEFKEKYNDYLSLIELLSELKSKAQKEILLLGLDNDKLKGIGQFTADIDDSYTSDDDVLTLSHKLLLSKVKLNIQEGVKKKLSDFSAAEKIHSSILVKVDEQIRILSDISVANQLSYINSEFDLNLILRQIKDQYLSFQVKAKKKTKKDEEGGLNFESKVKEGYQNILLKYSAKDNVSAGNLKRLSLTERVNSTMELIASVLEMSVEEATSYFFGEKKDDLIPLFKTLPLEKQKILSDALNEYKDEKSTAIDLVNSDEDEFHEVYEEVRNGNKLEALKLYKEMTGCSLEDAKKFVDSVK
jgi:tetratricopeptide (TPR) repeat protein